MHPVLTVTPRPPSERRDTDVANRPGFAVEVMSETHEANPGKPLASSVVKNTGHTGTMHYDRGSHAFERIWA